MLPLDCEPERGNVVSFASLIIRNSQSGDYPLVWRCHVHTSVPLLLSPATSFYSTRSCASASSRSSKVHVPLCGRNVCVPEKHSLRSLICEICDHSHLLTWEWFSRRFSKRSRKSGMD